MEHRIRNKQGQFCTAYEFWLECGSNINIPGFSSDLNKTDAELLEQNYIGKVNSLRTMVQILIKTAMRIETFGYIPREIHLNPELMTLKINEERFFEALDDREIDYRKFLSDREKLQKFKNATTYED